MFVLIFRTDLGAKVKCVLREVEGISVISDSFFSCCGAESRLSSDLFAVHFIRNLGRVRKSGMDGSRMTEPGDETEKKKCFEAKKDEIREASGN